MLALRRAVAVRCPSVGLIHHADRGSQCCSIEYQADLRKNGISISMSGKGNCFDNAIVETFFKTLKAELVWRTIFQSRIEAAIAIGRYIDELLQSRPPPFGARLHQPTSVRGAGSVKSKTLSTNAGQVQSLSGAAASENAQCVARDPDEPAAPIERRVWPPHRDLPVDRARWAQTSEGEF